MNFTPRAPASEVRGQIIDVVGGTDLVGQYQIVAINRGKRHGLEPGMVLAVDEAGYEVSDVYRVPARSARPSRRPSPRR